MFQMDRLGQGFKVKIATNGPKMDAVTSIHTVEEAKNDHTLDVATEAPKVANSQEEIKKDHLPKQHQGVQMRGKEHMLGKEEITEVDKAMNVEKDPEMVQTKMEDAGKVDNEVTVEAVTRPPEVEGG